MRRWRKEAESIPTEGQWSKENRSDSIFLVWTVDTQLVGRGVRHRPQLCCALCDHGVNIGLVTPPGCEGEWQVSHPDEGSEHCRHWGAHAAKALRKPHLNPDSSKRDGGLMLARRRRRWPNINPTFRVVREICVCRRGGGGWLRDPHCTRVVMTTRDNTQQKATMSWPDSLTAKLFKWNFHPLVVVSRWRDPQLQAGENYSDLTKLRSTILKSC